MRWIDQHCHLEPGASGAEQVKVARDAGVERMVTVGCHLEQSQQMATVAAEHVGVYATAGVHPHDSKQGLAGIEELLELPQVVAVGEAGLDYHYDHSPRPIQRDVFAAQIQMAQRHHLPLVIHSRSAWDETFEILDREGVPERTVFHCFTGGPDEAREALARNCLVSFSGIVTFPSGQDLRDAAVICPLDMLLVETDSPYLAPVPHRGKPNRPALVPLVGEKIAEVKGVPVAEVAAATWTTAARFYELRAADAAKTQALAD
ncbi:MAG: TatD family hydrolase [Acidimicrobiales bacterium]|nr:TatD family hydrolase [Acidimicrobiales bacterium]